MITAVRSVPLIAYCAATSPTGPPPTTMKS